MPSEAAEAYVWTWLPGGVEPVVAGRLDRAGAITAFTYGQSYLARDNAVPLYVPELPLGRGPIAPITAGEAPGCILDAAPDAWGRRVILNETLGADAEDTDDLTLLTYLLASGSNRIGALDFQRSATDYEPRGGDSATLEELAESAARVEAGVPLTPALDRALLHGSSVGGARPKAVIVDGGRQLIAKFSSSTDHYSVEKGEFVAMRLAALAGITASRVELTETLGRTVLLVERFDRPGDGTRRSMVSALTILGLGEHEARYASYADLAHVIRARFTEPKATLRELFARITFSVLVGNTDDHARNHAAFWDGTELTLTPAYDICPQPRSGETARQVMAIGEDGFRDSQLLGCVERAPTYGLTRSEARAIVEHQIEIVRDQWRSVCDEAGMTDVDRAFFWGRQFLNDYAFFGLGGS